MRLRILFLGPARDLTAQSAVSMEVPQGTIAASLRPLVIAKFPAIKAALSTMRLAVNQSFVSEDHVLHPNDEVALIPPVSGG
jgi:molybdopterin converting factor subunit 1